MRSVEELDGELRDVVETIGVDAPGLGMGARLVEALHPAVAAEEVLGGSGTEAIAGQLVTTAQQLKPIVRDHDMEETGHPADGAIAIESSHWRLPDFGFEADRSAVAAAMDLHTAVVRTRRRPRQREPARPSAG